jgi:pyruvate/2-oxoglutarate dehydrogenase complex dihydrolipoamide acyltransferase (E2) component
MPFVSINKSFGKPKTPSGFRRLALGSWASPQDPTIYGILELNVEKALSYIESQAATSSERITITHFVGKVFATVLEKFPELNSELRFGKFYPRNTIDLSFQVAIEKENGHHDLSAGFVGEANHKSISEIAKSLNHDARVIRAKNDPGFLGLKRISSLMPGIFLRFAVKLLQTVLSTLNLWSPILGLPKNAFGSILITNVGSLGLDFALPALFPPANVACIIAVGSIYRGPVYETDENNVVTKTTLERFVRLCGAFDHRYIDGLHASRIAREITRCFEHPETLKSTAR